MLRELTDALDAFTTACPLVLVVEDLHWSDRATLAWLAYVARRPDPARLLILGTYRPVEAMVQGHPLRAVLTELQPHGQCVELALESLSEAAVTAYLAQRFGGTRLVAALARVLHQRTRGNPLFLIAVVDELVRQQVVTEGPAGWDVRAGVDTISAIIPAHLRALIELQLAHCSPEDQTLLEAASVAGVEFAAAAVAVGIERADEEIEVRCAALAHQNQFLQAQGQAVWPDGTVTGCYGFRHALYHEVVYQQVPAGRQTRWHARIGTRLAQGFGEEAGDMAGVLAMHFMRGRLLPQAVPYLRQAGARAWDRAAFREAVAYFEQALQALAHLPEDSDTKALAIDLRLAVGHALSHLGEYGRQLALVGEAEARARALDDRCRLGRVLAQMADVLRITGDHDRAMATGQQALALAVELGDSALQAGTSYVLGRAYLGIGDFVRAAEWLRQSMEAADRESGGRRTDVRIWSRAWLAQPLSTLGAFAEGRRYGEEALRLATLAGRGQSPIVAYGCLGLLYLAQGDLEHAIPVLERGLALCRASGERAWLPGIAAGLGYASALQGRLAEGRVLLEEAIRESLCTGALRNHALWVTWLSEVCRLAGRGEEAWQHARQALDLAQQRKERGHEACALHQLGAVQAHAAPPDVAQAEASYRQALALAEELGMRPLQAHCHRGLGTLYATIGQREQARAELSMAVEMYRGMEMTFWLPETEAALAQVEGR
jgi:tetratricopeptide (TPR) repeat protein